MSLRSLRAWIRWGRGLRGDIERDALTSRRLAAKRVSLSMTQPAPAEDPYIGVRALSIRAALGLRSAVRRFGSRWGLARLSLRADVAELVDAHGSGPCGLRLVEVQVLSSA